MGRETVNRPTNFDENQEPFTIATPNFSVLSFSSKPYFSSSSDSISSQRHFNGDDNETDSQRSTGSSADSVFGSVPSRLEVEYAITAFQSFMIQGLSSSMSMLDRLQPVLNHCDPRILQSTGFQRVIDVFHLLQTVPSVQRMVVSISSDKTVWDAVMSNNEVQAFRQSLHKGGVSFVLTMLVNGMVLQLEQADLRDLTRILTCFLSS